MRLPTINEFPDLFMLIPSSKPEIRLAAPAIMPPIVALSAWKRTMPAALLGNTAVPAELVPR
jgi:hypothetical protein